MSCYEWEHGRITLPTASVAKVRDVVRHAAEEHKGNLLRLSGLFWADLPRGYRREDRYHLAVSAFLYGNVPTQGGWLPYGLPDPKLPAWRGVEGEGDRHGLWWDLQNLLDHSVTGRRVEVETDGWKRTEYQKTPPHRATKKDVEELIGKTTGVRFTVQCGEPSIRFDRRVVEWDVPNNNHACEHGREHPIARAFFRALDGVQWTRGSGGQIVGNNEYNGDSYEPGAGGNYSVSEYGARSARSQTGARR